jgi:hypothetical protein
MVEIYERRASLQPCPTSLPSEVEVEVLRQIDGRPSLPEEVDPRPRETNGLIAG